MALDLTGKFLPQFRELARTRLAQLRQLLAGPSPNAAAAAAQLHALAGEAGMLGLTEVVELAHEGERDARAFEAHTSTSMNTVCAAVDRLAAILDVPVVADTATEVSASHRSGQIGVLVVDDSPIVGETVCDALVEGGFEARLASSMDEIMDALTNHRPRAVVTDFMMPDFDAAELCRRVRALPGPPIKVLLVSGLEREELMPEVATVGADDAVSKQQGIDAIVAGVRELLGRHE